MPYRPSTVRVWADIREAAKCKWCHKPIVWVRTDANKRLPFPPGFAVRETVRDERQCRFDVLALEEVHRCKRPRAKSANADQQGRLL